MISPDALRAAIEHCERTYPNEGCGVFIARGDGVVARPMANIADRFHQRDPARFPRTSQTAYLFDLLEQLDVFDRAEADGGRVVGIFHSHADAGASFSAEDQELATADGAPLLPDVEYVVISICSKAAADIRRYAWNGGRFAERLLAQPFPLDR